MLVTPYNLRTFEPLFFVSTELSSLTQTHPKNTIGNVPGSSAFGTSGAPPLCRRNFPFCFSPRGTSPVVFTPEAPAVVRCRCAPPLFFLAATFSTAIPPRFKSLTACPEEGSSLLTPFSRRNLFHGDTTPIQIVGRVSW